MIPHAEVCVVCQHDIEHPDEAVQLASDGMVHELCAEDCPTCHICRAVTDEDDAGDGGWTIEGKHWTCKECLDVMAKEAAEDAAWMRSQALGQRARRAHRAVRVFATVLRMDCECPMVGRTCNDTLFPSRVPCPPCAARRVLRAAAKEVARG